MELGQVYALKDLRAEQQKENQPIEQGWYVASIQGVELKVGKSGDNRYLRVKYLVELPTGGEKVLYSNITLQHANRKAEAVGMNHLAMVIDAAGLTELQNTDQLIGARIKVLFDVRESEKWGKQNNAVSFEKLKRGFESAPF